MINGLERVIKYGQMLASQNASTANTLFGDLPLTMEIPPPRLPECEPWQLTVQLDHEKEVTGMFLSGHPLDHYKFEMRHYGVTPVADFNEFKEAIRMHPNPGRPFRLIGLVADAQHKIARKREQIRKFCDRRLFRQNRDHFIQRRLSAPLPFLIQGSTVFITAILNNDTTKRNSNLK